MVWRWWWIPLALGASGCWGLKACDPPRPVEYLPVKLWSCSRRDKRCEVYARFQNGIDCDLFKRFLRAECDAAAPPGDLRCHETDKVVYLREWFQECTEGDLTFAEVRDGGGWIR
ncbi:MAG TPA: hypothetical protein VIG99_00480 [Myxococcaceae bacterium]|jgi:hypothetical protein